MLDRTKIDLVEINVYRKLYWGNAVLKILATDPNGNGYVLLGSLIKDWMCDEVHKEKTSEALPDNNQRNVTFTVGDRDNTLSNILKRATVFELLGKRYHTKHLNQPLDIRRIWKFEGRYNSQDATPII